MTVTDIPAAWRTTRIGQLTEQYQRFSSSDIGRHHKTAVRAEITALRGGKCAKWLAEHLVCSYLEEITD